MKYISTRNAHLQFSASQVILQGLSEDQGLFIPDKLVHLELEKCLNDDYQTLAARILAPFLNDFNEEQIQKILHHAYDHSFDTDEITPLVHLKEVDVLELFHGPTSAFKDVALQFLPHLMKESLKIQDSKDEMIILTATSGDTGKAALEGFKNVEQMKMIVFYPKDGVSEVQKLQMLTTNGNNCYVIGVNGNFDDCQRMVKACLSDATLIHKMKENHQRFSSANSINVGRLLPQIVYYFKAYLTMVKNQQIKMGEKINVAVPTGNFGNILAAYISKQMGLPIEKFICASNENNVLTDFIRYGVYNINRAFKKTNSPSMDILISSNLERLLYFYCENDEMIKEMMEELAVKGSYEVNNLIKKKLLKDFYGGYATQEETKQIIQEVYEKENYLLDPHSAVAYKVIKDFKKENINSYKTLLCATASPYKFMETVYTSITNEKADEFEMMKRCEAKTKIPIPSNLKDLKEKEIRHHQNIEVKDMKKVLCERLGVSYD